MQPIYLPQQASKMHFYFMVLLIQLMRLLSQKKEQTKRQKWIDLILPNKIESKTNNVKDTDCDHSLSTNLSYLSKQNCAFIPETFLDFKAQGQGGVEPTIS